MDLSLTADGPCRRSEQRLSPSAHGASLRAANPQVPRSSLRGNGMTRQFGHDWHSQSEESPGWHRCGRSHMYCPVRGVRTVGVTFWKGPGNEWPLSPCAMPESASAASSQAFWAAVSPKSPSADRARPARRASVRVLGAGSDQDEGGQPRKRRLDVAGVTAQEPRPYQDHVAAKAMLRLGQNAGQNLGVTILVRPQEKWSPTCWAQGRCRNGSITKPSSSRNTRWACRLATPSLPAAERC